MKRTLSILIVSLVVCPFLGGCANLDEVRQFAGESARLVSYQELTTHFRDTYARESPYLSGPSLAVAQASDAKRQNAYKDLLKVSSTVGQYMMTLASAAGDKTFDISKGINEISGQIKAYPDLGFDAKHVDAVTGIAQILGKWTTTYLQADAVQDMIRTGDPLVQTSLDGMSNLLRVYRKTHDNERRNVLGLFETEFALAQIQNKDLLLMALARKLYVEKVAEFALIDQKFDVAEKAIGDIAEGHAKLYRNVNDLSAKELKDELSLLVKDLKQLSKQIQALQ